MVSAERAGVTLSAARIGGSGTIGASKRRTALFSVALLLMVLVFGAGDFASFARPEPAATTTELAQGWKMVSATGLPADGRTISTPEYQDSGWHTVARMPATVLDALQQDGTYPDLYYGTNLADKVPQDLYKQDWWYRTTFDAPAGHSNYQLQFPGINYRAEIWLNGHLIADSTQIVGMYTAHDLDVTPWVRAESNVLAVKVIPERALQDIDGVELADSWWDWINWRYLGYQGLGANPVAGNSFIPDRNAGIFKPVYLRTAGAAELGDASVNTELPLPRTDSARLTVYANVHNSSARRVNGVLRATISRPGKPQITLEQPVTLSPGERREVTFSPARFTELTVEHPDLWWPYTMGDPDLYDLKLEFRQYNRVIDSSTKRFGIRTIAQHRDTDEQFPELGTGGSFYLTVNGRDFLVRGAVYTPDLLFDNDPGREDAILRYAKDLGLNLLRLESKIPGERLIEKADELGIPLMVGWMCCNQWEKWEQWDDEDRAVALESLRSQILMLRSHPSVAIWANGSDGLPPEPLRGQYHAVLRDLHWQNAVVDTVSSFGHDDEQGKPQWDGIHMAGPYSWRPPSYWFSGRYGATRGSNAEQGDNEHIPPLASLKEFIPPDRLWPINDTWSFHAGSNPGNAKLSSIRLAILRRYGPSASVEEFTRKAQLAHYESTRAQFEAFAANGWANHKMTIYWMLNSHWPSFFGNIFDYYLRPGGAYYGAKTGLRPLSLVFDSYATGNHSTADVKVVNQTPHDVSGLRARVRVYDLSGRVRDDRTVDGVAVASGGAHTVLTLPREARDSRVFFVRAELLGADGTVVSQNVYWQSQQPDDVGDPANDTAFDLKQAAWADMTPLNSMTKAPLEVSAKRVGDRDVAVRLHNPGKQIAFFERAEITGTADGDEILPIEYTDNYVTVFPGETVDLRATIVATGQQANFVRVSGYNTAPVVVPVG